jgi:hypothetical protein
MSQGKSLNLKAVFTQVKKHYILAATYQPQLRFEKIGNFLLKLRLPTP